MSVAQDLVASPAAALAFATALEQTLGEDALLTVGTPPRTDFADPFEGAPTRVVTLAFTTAAETGMVALLASAPFAETLERAASDELLVTAAGPALAAAIAAIGGGEPDTQSFRPTLAEVAQLQDDAETAAHDWAVFPILDGTDLVALFVVHAGAATAAGADEPARPAARQAAPAATSPSDSGNAFVLADVEMGVTAELGRTRMTIRELLSVTPGAVIDLDRAAGSPVDVLVNGTLIARGEVVVIDEEFGIRISEIIPSGSAH